MDNELKLNRAERKLAQLLASEPQEWTVDCLTHEDLIDFLKDGAEYPGADTLRTHLVSCAYCRASLAELRSAQREAARMIISRPLLRTAKQRALSPSVRLMQFTAPGESFAAVAIAVTIGVCVYLTALAQLRRYEGKVRSVNSQFEAYRVQSQQDLKSITQRFDGLRQENATLITTVRSLHNGTKISGSSKELYRVAFRDGGEEILIRDDGKAVKSDRLSHDAQLAVLNQTIVIAARPNQFTTNSVYPLGTSDVTVIDPVDKVVTRKDLEFLWKPVEGAKYYSLEFVLPGSNSKPVTVGHIVGTNWRPQLHDREFARLIPGDVYGWRVIATTGRDGQDKTVVSADRNSILPKFKLLTAAQERALALARAQVPHSHLELGVLYSKYGLVEQAKVELSALVAANPNSRIAKTLLDSVLKRSKVDLPRI